MLESHYLSCRFSTEIFWPRCTFFRIFLCALRLLQCGPCFASSMEAQFHDPMISESTCRAAQGQGSGPCTPEPACCTPSQLDLLSYFSGVGFCFVLFFTQSMVWIIQQKVSLLLPKTNTHFILEPKRIQTIELKWRAVDAEMGSAAHASRSSGRGWELARHGAIAHEGNVCSFPSSALCF